MGKVRKVSMKPLLKPFGLGEVKPVLPDQKVELELSSFWQVPFRDLAVKGELDHFGWMDEVGNWWPLSFVAFTLPFKVGESVPMALLVVDAGVTWEMENVNVWWLPPVLELTSQGEWRWRDWISFLRERIQRARDPLRTLRFFIRRGFPLAHEWGPRFPQMVFQVEAPDPRPRRGVPISHSTCQQRMAIFRALHRAGLAAPATRADGKVGLQFHVATE